MKILFSGAPLLIKYISSLYLGNIRPIKIDHVKVNFFMNRSNCYFAQKQKQGVTLYI